MTQGAPIQWIANDHFRLNGIDFLTSQHGATIDDAEKRGAIWVMKNVELLALYEDRVAKLEPQLIMEVGVAGGGGAAVLNERFKPRTLCLVDLVDVTSPSFKAYLKTPSASNIRLHLDVDQSDQGRLAKVVELDFGNSPLDLVIDDASHLYEPSLATFEELFPRVRPGGFYIIEDWGWSHWKGDYWQGQNAPWATRFGLSNLIHQLVMASASNPELVKSMLVTSAGCVVERGPQVIAPRTSISEYYLNRGKRWTLT